MIFATQWRYGEWKNYWGFPSEKMEQEETPEETPTLMANLIAWYNDSIIGISVFTRLKMETAVSPVY